MTSKILALICLTIVHRLRPAWTAVSPTAAARAENVNPERISRLATKALGGFERVVALLLRRGRPPKDRDTDALAKRLALTQALLEITSTLCSYLSWRRPALRALVLGAYLRLRQEHPTLTQHEFCEALALSPRTLRHWLANHDPKAPPASPRQEKPATSPPRKRPPRRPRFGFQLLLPETQLAADTTDLEVFGVPLKLIAAQDVGGRDQNLFDSVILDDHENADLVVEVLVPAIAGREGLQVVTDQGTPYLAELTRDTIAALGAEHAPQREADPLGKATVERAFGTVKSIAGPLFTLTCRLAKKIPALRQKRLAIALGTILLVALLKAYQAGARAARRADEAREGLSREDLQQAAQQHREQARAEDHSKVMLLSFIHEAYDIKRPRKRFIRSLRHFPLQVLKLAERAFAKQVHRDDIRDRASYFYAIVRHFHREYQAQQARQRAIQDQNERLAQRQHQAQQQQLQRDEDPAGWLREALDSLAAQWQPQTQSLLFGGSGLGRSWLQQALARLAETHGPATATDIAWGVFHRFAETDSHHLGPAGLAALQSILQAHLPAPPQPDPNSTCTQNFGAAILHNTGPPPRSGPTSALLTYAARRGGS
jgi:transposase InsO family protein